MCGIGTTLVEAIHQDRRALGLELDARWAALAAGNVGHARAQGATGQALVIRDDARRLGRGVLDEYAGKVSLILTSPPYGDATLGDPRGGRGMAVARACEGRRVTAADRAHAATRSKHCRYGDSGPCLARLPYGTVRDATAEDAGQSTGESYLSAMASIYAACARMLAPGGFLIVVTKNLRAQGTLRNLAGDTIALCQHAGLDYWQHVIALLAGIGIREGELRAAPVLLAAAARPQRARGRRAHPARLPRGRPRVPQADCSSSRNPRSLRQPPRRGEHAKPQHALRRRWQIKHADCLKALPTLDAASVDAVITDPPYGINANNMRWDRPSDARPGTRARTARRQRRPELPPSRRSAHSGAREALRVLKPGGHLAAFAAPRTFHLLARGLEEAGFELRDVLMWLQGQGYPATQCPSRTGSAPA